MTWIQNVSRDAIKTGQHMLSPNMMLIQVSDPTSDHPMPRHSFTEIHQFTFLDIEDNDPKWNEFKCWSITDNDAFKIVQLLRAAIIRQMNVVVHCNMGLCRSGAIVETGVALGMVDTGTYRQPNVTIKRKLFDKAGFIPSFQSVKMRN